MTIKHELSGTSEALLGFDPTVFSPDIDGSSLYLKYAAQKEKSPDIEVTSPSSPENDSVGDLDNDQLLSNSDHNSPRGASKGIMSADDAVPPPPPEEAPKSGESQPESKEVILTPGPSEQGLTGMGDGVTNPVFRLELTKELNKIVEQDESEELAMDYPSLSPLDINEVKARRRELEARKFQEELGRMSIQLADRLKKIPSYSRRSYKKESIYVKDLYTLTYEDGETLESIGHVSRHNDREEIRRRLAMGGEDEPPAPPDHRKLSLQTRLQTGMNLQICFMNETASDCESQCSDTESTQDHRIDNPKGHKSSSSKSSVCLDFASRQTQLQAEARQALGQAKDMARMQMEVERQQKRCSPVTEIIRQSFSKIGLTLPDNKRRLSRQLLTDMNVAQLQVIVNHMHTQIEGLNEELVRHLLNRDDLHMEQDSRLVDIEDLTNHLAAKERSNSTSSSSSIGGAHSKSSPSTSSSSMSTSSRTPSTTTSTTPRTPVSTPPPPMSAPLPNDALRMKGLPTGSSSK